MWTPERAEEVERAARNGEIQETATFDAKAEIGRAKEVAKDIAAMANDGGVLLYGIGEDDNDHPTVLQPFELKGAKEKIANWVQTCIAPAPIIRPDPLPKEDDPSIGYLVVEVPASPDAPHMVTKSQNNRFYGRNGPRNVRLSAGEVERLFQRRESWKRDREKLIDEFISDAPPERDADQPTMHLVASPLASDDELLERALSEGDPRQETALRNLFRQTQKELDLHFRRHNVLYDQRWERRGDRYITHLGALPDDERTHEQIVDLQIYFDGSAYHFDGEFAAKFEGASYLREGAVVVRTVRLLHFLAKIYEEAQYVGPVDLAIKLSGIGGCISGHLRDGRRKPHPNPIKDDEYADTARTYPQEMQADPLSEAQKLIGRFIDYTTEGRAYQFFGS